MNKTYNLSVYYKEKKVGTLALISNNKVAFQYDSQWIKSGFSNSPFSNHI